MSVSCDIRAEPVPGFVRLRAVARSENALRGEYRLFASKRSETGTTQNVQSGAFFLTPGAEETLSILTLDQSARGHYEARLILEWEGGRTSCQSP
ncbi:curli-like amyloid fiber formation chaperone CsgH [Methylobacterium durans]|uniref:curli-like amyloid fiber formation chaperone CsgH n=1 Tax=Methylobacterium durans TaxID=2202825 RepID=UPI003C6D8E42